MTEERLHEIEKRAQVVAEWPWYRHDDWMTIVNDEVVAIVNKKYAELVALSWQDIPDLLEEVMRLQAELSDANKCITKLERYLSVISEASEYIKPNTGVWHTVGIALEAVQKWRGISGLEDKDGTINK